MKCYAQWYGGSSYSLPEADEFEVFPSIAAAAAELGARIDDHFYPGVELDSTMRVWIGAPPDVPFPCDSCPDRLIRFSPLGNVVIERC